MMAENNVSALSDGTQTDSAATAPPPDATPPGRGDATSPLFATEPVAARVAPEPVIVVGLPRSGTSFLSDVLTQIENWYVFDDLYLFRRARGLGIGEDDLLTTEQLDRLIHFLGWQLRGRIKYNNFYSQQISLEQVDRFDGAMRATFAGRPVRWHQLQHEWLARLALHNGRTHWGYKAPQDFMHIDLLNRLYPGVRYVFLYRDPRRMMASFKHMTRDNRDGDPRQYHPLAYALYWKMAAETMRRAAARLPGRVCEVRFETLIGDTDSEATRIAAFLSSRCAGPIAVKTPNSSFGGARRAGITPTETWLCERIAGAAMRQKGYTLENARWRLRDLPALALTTTRFGVYQCGRALTNKGAGVSIGNFLRALRRR